MFKFHTCRLGSSKRVEVSAAETREHSRAATDSSRAALVPAPPPQSFHFSAHSSHSYSGDLSHNSCRVQTGQLLCLRAGLDEQKSPGGKPGLHWRRDRSLNSRTAAHTSALSSLEPPGQPFYVLGVPEAVWAADLGSR